MGILGDLGSGILSTVLQIAIGVVIVGLIIFIIGEACCKYIPIVSGPIISTVGSIPILGYPLTFTSCYGDGLPTSLEGAGKTLVAAHKAMCKDLKTFLPGAMQMVCDMESDGPSCGDVQKQLSQAIMSVPEKFGKDPQLSTVITLALDLKDRCGVDLQPMITAARRAHSADLGTPKTHVIEVLDFFLYGTKFAGRFCSACGPGKMTFRTETGDQSDGDADATAAERTVSFKQAVECPEGTECRAPYPGEEEDCPDVYSYEGVGTEKRCRPKYNCGSGIQLGVASTTCKGGFYCKHEPTLTVGKCTPIPPGLLSCATGCSAGTLGPGWVCVNGTCVNACGPAALPGLNRANCLIGENAGIRSPPPGYIAGLAGVITPKHNDYVALTAHNSGIPPSVTRIHLPWQADVLSGRPLRSSIDGEIYVVEYGVKYHVPAGTMSSSQEHVIPTVKTPGRMIRYQGTSTTSTATFWQAASVFNSYAEAIRYLDTTVPFPDGTKSPGLSAAQLAAARSAWPVTKVFPDWGTVTRSGGTPLYNAKVSAEPFNPDTMCYRIVRVVSPRTVPAGMPGIYVQTDDGSLHGVYDPKACYKCPNFQNLCGGPKMKVFDTLEDVPAFPFINSTGNGYRAAGAVQRSGSSPAFAVVDGKRYWIESSGDCKIYQPSGGFSLCDPTNSLRFTPSFGPYSAPLWIPYRKMTATELKKSTTLSP